MTGCLSLLQTAADMDRVLTCYGGAAWRDTALLGLYFVLGLMAFAFVLWLALRLEPDPWKDGERRHG